MCFLQATLLKTCFLKKLIINYHPLQVFWTSLLVLAALLALEVPLSSIDQIAFFIRIQLLVVHCSFASVLVRLFLKPLPVWFCLSMLFSCHQKYLAQEGSCEILSIRNSIIEPYHRPSHCIPKVWAAYQALPRLILQKHKVGWFEVSWRRRGQVEIWGHAWSWVFD